MLLAFVSQFDLPQLDTDTHHTKRKEKKCSSYLAICSMCLSPGSHDKSIIDGNASHLLYTFTFQVLCLLHKPREVSLKVTRQTNFQRLKRWLRKRPTKQVKTQTFEQPGVNAPGTAKRTPFFPLKSWFIATLFPGSPSWTSTAGRCSPACWRSRKRCELQEPLEGTNHVVTSLKHRHLSPGDYNTHFIAFKKAIPNRHCTLRMVISQGVLFICRTVMSLP